MLQNETRVYVEFSSSWNTAYKNVYPHPIAITEFVALHLNFDRIPSESITIYDCHYYYCDSHKYESLKHALMSVKNKSLAEISARLFYPIKRGGVNPPQIVPPFWKNHPKSVRNNCPKAYHPFRFFQKWKNLKPVFDK